MNQTKNPKIIENTAVVIFAAGKGTRMGNDELSKVCFEIDGVPAINRIISTFRKLNFQKILPKILNQNRLI